MTSEARALLQKKLDARDKAIRLYLDGFVRSDFAGLTSTEVEEVRGILTERSKNNDSIALGGLAKLLTADAFAKALPPILAKVDPNDEVAAQILTFLYRQQPSSEGLESLLNLLETGTKEAKCWVMRELKEAGVPGTYKDQVVELLVDIIESDVRNGPLLMSTIDYLLLLRGYTPRTQEWKEIALRLMIDDKRSRSRILLDRGLRKSG